MSSTRSVGCYGGHTPKRPDPRREIWASDAALSLLLAQLIRDVEGRPPDRRPDWWADRVAGLRVQAVVGDFFLDLALGLDAAQREEFAGLLADAAARIGDRRTFTAVEAAGWRVLDDKTVIFRGDRPAATGPVAELGQALADLIRGTLPAPPPGHLWYYGAPGGLRTIAMSGLTAAAADAAEPDEEPAR
ncbi:hypothetical protein [Plantactinospora sp. WMMB782]|uniref:hypothetical protein n=1 Tax=Plantactinospora sp. WMMB782 TaxID=3404121 RepID=UPI003B9543E8